MILFNNIMQYCVCISPYCTVGSLLGSSGFILLVSSINVSQEHLTCLCRRQGKGLGILVTCFSHYFGQEFKLGRSFSSDHCHNFTILIVLINLSLKIAYLFSGYKWRYTINAPHKRIRWCKCVNITWKEEQKMQSSRLQTSRSSPVQSFALHAIKIEESKFTAVSLY